MCDHPYCSDNSANGPQEITEQNEPVMLAEATLAALHAMGLCARGWINGAQGLLSDMGEKWGFLAIMRMAWVMTLGLSHLPATEGGLKRATLSDLEEQMPDMDPEERARVAAMLLNVGDQVHAAYNELQTLAATPGAEGWKAFQKRFDEITDQQNMLQPLVAALIFSSGARMGKARTDQNTAALDQFHAACTADLDMLDPEMKSRFQEMTKEFNRPDPTTD